MSIELKNDHNVYILGAGFSREAGLPLISDFLLRMRDSHPWLISNGRQKEADAVEAVLKFRLKAASAAYWTTLDLENIEELFSLASASTASISSDIQLAIAATLDFARETAGNTKAVFGFQNVSTPPTWVNSAGWLKGGIPGRSITDFQVEPYAHHVAKLLGMFQDGKVKGENTFITFNYDTVLEDALSVLKVPFTYGFKKQSSNRDGSAKMSDDCNSLKVLKLHGSMNWARRTKQRGRAFTVYGSHADVRNVGLVPELVPPTWKKNFEGQLNDVWKTAVQSLQTATRVIIIGFSMPPNDMHFRYLMAAGLQENISLRKIIFFSLSIGEIRTRALPLLRASYIDTEAIEFRPTQFTELVKRWEHLEPIGRPFPDQSFFSAS